jgi:hypothetical protein
MALGLYVASEDGFIVVLGDGGTYMTSYIFLEGDNSRMIGRGWIEPTGTPVSGSGSAAVGSRILTPSELGVTAPAGMTVNAK